MLLAVDMGNTQTALGLFDGDSLVASWRMPTDRTFTKDEIHIRLQGYLSIHGLALDYISDIAFAGVVPQLVREWRGVAAQLGVKMMQVKADTAAVTSIDAPNPAEVGAVADRQRDRRRRALRVPGHRRRLRNRSQPRRHRCPGGLYRRRHRARHPHLDGRPHRPRREALERPPRGPARAIGRSTAEAVQSGAVMGAAAMAEGLVARIKRELGEPDALVIATGGLSGMVAECTDAFDVLDQQLTIKGICEIWRRMQA